MPLRASVHVYEVVPGDDPRQTAAVVVGDAEVPHAEPRKVISVDMTRMDKLLSIDEKNTTAEIEAGANGRLLEEQLKIREKS